MIASPGQAIRRRELVQTGWPHGAQVRDNTLDAYIARLRRKLGSHDGAPMIATVARRRLRDRMSVAARRTHAAAAHRARSGLVALVIATIGFNLLLARSNDQSADSLLRQRADSERSLIRVAGGRLVTCRDLERRGRRQPGVALRGRADGGGATSASRDHRSRTIAGAGPEPVRDRRGHRRAPVLASDRRPRRARRHDRHRRLACPLRAGTSLRALRITRLRNDGPADRGRRRLVAAAVRAPPGAS